MKTNEILSGADSKPLPRSRHAGGLIVLFILIFIFIGVVVWRKTIVQNETSLTKRGEIVVSMYSGSIGKKYPIQMKLKRNRNRLNGTLLNSFNRKKSVAGKLFDGKIFFLNEFEKGVQTGSFLGKFVSRMKVIGIWSTPDGKMSSPFYLKKEMSIEKKSKSMQGKKFPGKVIPDKTRIVIKEKK